MNNNLKNHWENIYQNKNEYEVSWFQKTPDTSIEIINSINLKKQSKIIDVGSGRSRLFKNLIEQGYNNLTYLDISESAAKKSKFFNFFIWRDTVNRTALLFCISFTCHCSYPKSSFGISCTIINSIFQRFVF